MPFSSRTVIQAFHHHHHLVNWACSLFKKVLRYRGRDRSIKLASPVRNPPNLMYFSNSGNSRPVGFWVRHNNYSLKKKSLWTINFPFSTLIPRCNFYSCLWQQDLETSRVLMLQSFVLCLQVLKLTYSMTTGLDLTTATDSSISIIKRGHWFENSSFFLDIKSCIMQNLAICILYIQVILKEKEKASRLH